MMRLLLFFCAACPAQGAAPYNGAYTVLAIHITAQLQQCTVSWASEPAHGVLQLLLKAMQAGAAADILFT